MGAYSYISKKYLCLNCVVIQNTLKVTFRSGGESKDSSSEKGFMDEVKDIFVSKIIEQGEKAWAEGGKVFNGIIGGLFGRK